MNPWFRFYNEVLDDPKVQALSGENFKAWVNLLCLACKHDGVFPAMQDCAFALRTKPSSFRKIHSTLAGAGLVRGEITDDSCGFPHGWEKRQRAWDSSTQRAKASKQRSKTVDATLPDRHPNVSTSYVQQTRTEQTLETDSDESRPHAEQTGWNGHATLDAAGKKTSTRESFSDWDETEEPF